MRAPIEVTLDHTLAPPPAYVRYSHEPFARTDSLDPEGSVNVDRSADGGVIGIELLAVDDYTLGLAAEVARAHDLVLPDMPEGRYNPAIGIERA